MSSFGKGGLGDDDGFGLLSEGLPEAPPPKPPAPAPAPAPASASSRLASPAPSVPGSPGGINRPGAGLPTAGALEPALTPRDSRGSGSIPVRSAEPASPPPGVGLLAEAAALEKPLQPRRPEEPPIGSNRSFPGFDAQPAGPSSVARVGSGAERPGSRGSRNGEEEGFGLAAESAARSPAPLPGASAGSSGPAVGQYLGSRPAAPAAGAPGLPPPSPVRPAFPAGQQPSGLPPPEQPGSPAIPVGVTAAALEKAKSGTSPRKEDRPWETQHIDYTSPRSNEGFTPRSGHGSPLPMSSTFDATGGKGGQGQAGQGQGQGGPGSNDPNRVFFATSPMTQRHIDPARDTLLSVEQANTMVATFPSGIRHAGWLYKLVGKTPLDVNWKRYWFYLVDDRLYYSANANREQPIEGVKTRYIALDRVPVRPLPHRRKRVDPSTMTIPDIGISMVDTRVLAHLGVKLKPDTCFGLVSGAHTYFLAADSPQEAKAWVKALRSMWMHCFKHTLRGTDAKDLVHETSRLLAQNEALRKSLATAGKGQFPGLSDNSSEYWRAWLEEKARVRSLEDQLHGSAQYEIEVKTGRMKGASTDARVYVELYGPYDEVSTGELRLVHADSHLRSYQRNALDLFICNTKDVGLPRTIKVWHDNTGRHPDWFLEYIRIRKRIGYAPAGPAPSTHGPESPAAGHTTPGAYASPARTSAGGMRTSMTGLSPAGRAAASPMRSPAPRGTFTSPAKSVLAGAGSKYGTPTRSTTVAVTSTGGAGTASPYTGTPTHPAAGASGGKWSQWVVFPCQRWFSTQLDDCRISRTLFAGHQSPLIQYKVETLTSDLRGAGTDANVFLIMHGTLGDGTRHILTAGHDDFNRGVANEFVIDDEELGELLEITIGHDGSGYSPSWHLDHVMITNLKTGQRFIFPCRMWFDSRMGDGRIERILPVAADAGKLVPYVFNITTSDIRGAGTDADVHVALHGDLGSTPVTQLPSRPEHFERGNTDSFRMVLPYVGTVQSLTVGHNNKGPGPEWHLEAVEVVDEDHKRSYWFACGKWLATNMDDGLLERTLLALDKDPRSAYTDYKIDFYTSTMRGAGTDAVVYFQLCGDGGDSEVQRVVAPREAFERGCVDSFTYRMRYLGRLRRMLVQHDNSGANPAWHLFKVLVTCTKDGAATTFVCNDWIRSEDPTVHPSVELLADQPVPLMLRYRLEVATSDLRGAGTDSNVWVEIHGMQGRVGPVQLDNPAAFDRGARDVFHVEGADVGQLVKLVVSVDGRGTRPLWHLDSITVYRDAALAGSQDAATFFPCRAWFDKELGMTKELFPMRRDLDMAKAVYIVRVLTSDLKGAGTDASIDLALIGSRGETGWHRLVSNYDTFERAQEDVFTLTMLDVGPPVALLLRTDARSNKPTWHVDCVVVEIPEGPRPGYPAFFVANCWLGPAPQLPQEVRLQPVPHDPRGDRAEYFVWVHTSDVRFAGTDAGIVLEILGDRGSSGRKPLVGDGTKDLFERAQVDEFCVQCRTLGALRAIRLQSDGKSTKPSWHLDHVVIQAPTGEKYWFTWNNWIGPAPNLLEVEIPATLLDPTQGRRMYKVVTHTSDLRAAGTDANVYVDIRGGLGATGKTWLKNANPDCFERGQADEFEVRAPGDLGPLVELVIGHDNSGQGPGWHLEQVDITDIKTGQTWYFDCNQWLDSTQGDGLIERLLKPSLQNPRTARTVYYVCVKTSTMPNAGTDAKVYIEIRGDQGSSGKQFLKNSSPNPFESGQTDEFQIPCRSLGTLRELVIGHDNSGLNPNWHLEVVSITDLAAKITYWFACNKWFDLSKDDGKIERILPASLQPPEARRVVPYQVTVKTSDVSGAGTDANVFICMYGEDGADTGKIKLDNPKNNFERGATDVFTINAKEVDPLRKIRIGHDNSGVGAAWHLERVEVLNKLTGARYIFNCNRWFSTKHDDFQIERDLFPLGSTVEENIFTISTFTSDIQGAGTDANITCILYGDKGETGALKLDNPKNNFERGQKDVFAIRAEDVGKLQKMKITSDDKGMGSAWHLDIVTVTSAAQPGVTYWFYCGQWFDKAHGLEKTLTAWLTDPRNSLTTYTVITHTSDIANAGTDANVYVNMFGTKGESGAHELDNSANNFERGKADTFKLKMVDLGELTELEVWHDNSGLGPGWHLDYIEVQSSATGRVYYFPCSQWFDKKQGDGAIKRRLIATTKDPRSFKSQYRVTTITSDISGAGTDANVFIIIYGPEGDTGKVMLDNKLKNDFERGQTDVFEFESKAVGQPMSKIRIGHDGSGLGSGWHLARVIVENLSTGECVTFECNRWLDKGEDDGQIERELFPSSSIVGGTNWKLTVITGDESGAGTDANVFCAIRGDKGSYGPHMLAAQKGAFETGSRDVFSLTTPDLGPIRELTMGHDNKGMGAAWYLDSCELENVATGEKWMFDFKCWLDAKRGLQQTRPPSGYKPPTKGGLSDYRVELTTGPDDSSRLDKGVVSIDIRGQSVSTGRLALEMPPHGFWPWRMETYFFAGQPDTGGIIALEIGHTGPEPWFVKEVLVVNETTGARGLFEVNRLLHPNDYVVILAKESAPVDYNFEVQTSDRFNAGTSANVWVNLMGTQASTGRQPLDSKAHVEGASTGSKGTLPAFCSPSEVCRPRSVAFNRNGRGSFVLRQLPDVGIMKALEIGHDNSGISPGWHLAWVMVTNTATGATAFFPCNQWLAKNEGDRKIERILDAETQSAPMPAPTGTAVVSVLPQQPAVAVPAAPPGIPTEAYLDPGHLLRKLGAGGVGQPGYKLIFHTSNVVMAGTNAPVFFELVGENGSSGTVVARATMGQFSRGSKDEFIYPRMPYLGDLLQLRVGTTGQGMFATWHLRTVEVVHLSTGDTWAFGCHSWIDKKTQWQKILTAQRAR